jgi:hypothetical protein
MAAFKASHLLTHTPAGGGSPVSAEVMLTRDRVIESLYTVSWSDETPPWIYHDAPKFDLDEQSWLQGAWNKAGRPAGKVTLEKLDVAGPGIDALG